MRWSDLLDIKGLKCPDGKGGSIKGLEGIHISLTKGYKHQGGEGMSRRWRALMLL